MEKLLNSNFFGGVATFLTAIVAILLYYWEQRKKKNDAAKIIVQEIRRAEDVINEYKEHKAYKFTKKIIATNSWAKNIHYFVNDLAQDEIDKISNLYSTGEYLDSIISKVSDHNFESGVKNYEAVVNQIQSNMQNQQTTLSNDSQNNTPRIGIPVKIDIPAPWNILLEEVSNNYQPIYHSSICEKLKRIAKLD